MKSTGPVHELIAKTPGWRGTTLAHLREIVRDADPEAIEDVKWRRPSNPNGSAVWEDHGIVCVGIVLKRSVRLSFFAGSRLPDPAKLFNAQLNGMSRAIDFFEGDAIDRRALVALVRSAVAHNRAKKRPGTTSARPGASSTRRTARPRPRPRR